MPESMNDPFNLKRFVDEQNFVYEEVCSELKSGRKSSHWMWFIFPQIRGLGSSSTAREFAIASVEEAAAYLQHPVLGPRLRECTRLMNRIEGRPIDQILGYPDVLKFRSSMTLFAHATSDNQDFMDALRKYFGGEFDSLTLDRL